MRSVTNSLLLFECVAFRDANKRKKLGYFGTDLMPKSAKSLRFYTAAAAPQLQFIAVRLGGVALRHAHADTG
jgi:hypothetical protein